MKKTAKYISMGLLVIIAITLLYAYIAYPAEYVNRVLRWGNADIYDYQKFPERPLEASGSPFEFSNNLDEEHVQTQFEHVSGMDDFDTGTHLSSICHYATVILMRLQSLYQNRLSVL